MHTTVIMLTITIAIVMIATTIVILVLVSTGSEVVLATQNFASTAAALTWTREL